MILHVFEFVPGESIAVAVTVWRAQVVASLSVFVGGGLKGPPAAIFEQGGKLPRFEVYTSPPKVGRMRAL